MTNLERRFPFLILILLMAASCGGTEAERTGPAPAAEDTRDDIYLSFALDRDGFANETLDFPFRTDTRSRNLNYWMAYKDRDQTTFRMEGRSGLWSVDINFKISAERLGTYPFEPDDLNSNRDVDFTLRPEGEQRRLYYAQNATLELLEHSGDYISGTFSGTFFRGSIVNQEERTQVGVSDGKFRVNWAEGQSSKNKDKWQ